MFQNSSSYFLYLDQAKKLIGEIEKQSHFRSWSQIKKPDKKMMMNDFDIYDIPEGLLIPIVASFGIVGNLGKLLKIMNLK